MYLSVSNFITLGWLIIIIIIIIIIIKKKQAFLHCNSTRRRRMLERKPGKSRIIPSSECRASVQFVSLRTQTYFRYREVMAGYTSAFAGYG